MYKKLLKAKSDKLAQMQAITDSAADGILTEEQRVEFDALNAEVEKLNASIDKQEKLLKEKNDLDAKMRIVPAPHIMQTDVHSNGNNEPQKVTVPATAKKWSSGNLKSFKNAEDAYSSGMWLAAILGNKKASQWCAERGIGIEAVSQGSNNTNGGYLVPDVLSSSIIELLLEYGMFRKNTTVLPMVSDSLHIPRRAGGLTAYFVNDDSAITESTKTWDLVSLYAKDVGVTTRIANDLISDAIIPIVDNVVNEMAYTLAKKEDDCGFLGDGTSTYGGITGLSQRLISVHSSTGILTGTMTYGVYRYDTGYAFSNVALADITAMMSRLPSYARGRAKFYCNPAFYYGAMLPLLTAAGGTTGLEIAGGYGEPKFLGYPVVLCESIAGTAAVNTIFLYFGDLGLASKLGDRQQITTAMSDSATVGGYSVFERNQIALRAVERFDINVHDVGVASASAGAIVAMMSHTA